jgi:hypothetical protein
MFATCECHSPPFHFADYETVELGEDSYGAEVSLLTCRQCALVWLKYLLEEPHYNRSGRWWRVAVPPEHLTDFSVDSARDFIQQQEEGFVGGSFFKSTGRRVSAPICVD